MEPTGIDGAPQETIVDVVTGGQRCRSCDYSLKGQHVFVPSQLDFPMVRCPECGVLHPSGQDSLSGVEAKRRAASSLSYWIAGHLLIVLGIAGAIGGLAQSTGFASCAPLGYWIGRRSPRGGGLFTWTGDVWWERTGKPKLARESLEVWGMVDWWVLADILWAIPIGLAAGVWFHVRMLHATRKGKRVMSFLIAGVSLVGLIGYVGLATHSIRVRENRAIDLAMVETGYVVMFASWVVILAIVLAGLRCGRGITCWMIMNFGSPRVKAWGEPLLRSGS